MGILKGSSLNMLESKPITFRIFDFIGQETAIHYSRIYSRLENANCSLLGCLLFAISTPVGKNFFHLGLDQSSGAFQNFFWKVKIAFKPRELY